MKLYIYLTFFLLISTTIFATEHQTVELTFNEYKQALKTYNTEKMTELMHPDALIKFRIAVDEALTGEKSNLAVKSLLPLFSVKTLSEYRNLSNEETYTRMNTFVAKSQPKLIDMVKAAEVDVVNESIQGDLAYVVYSLAMVVNEQKLSNEVTQKFKLHNGKWLLLLPQTAEASIMQIKAKF